MDVNRAVERSNLTTFPEILKVSNQTRVIGFYLRFTCDARGSTNQNISQRHADIRFCHWYKHDRIYIVAQRSNLTTFPDILQVSTQTRVIFLPHDMLAVCD